MICRILIILLFFGALGVERISAQNTERYNVFSYNVNEGLLQTSVIDAAFDENNFFWLSFPNGIQKFDGKNFIKIPVQPGLPDDKMADLFRCTNGTVLISHMRGISRYDPAKDKFTWIYQSAEERTPLQIISEEHNKLYAISKNSELYIFESENLRVISKEFLVVDDGSTAYLKFQHSDKVIDNKIVFQFGDTLFLSDLDTKKVIARSPPVHNIAGFFLQQISAGRVLYYVVSGDSTRLRSYDFHTGKDKSLIALATSKNKTWRSSIFRWEKKTMLSIFDNIYETDSSLTAIKAVLLNYQNRVIGGNSTIVRVGIDNYGNLYPVTINEGFKKMLRNNYRVKYFGSNVREDNYVLSVLPDKKNNRVLVGTSSNGLIIFDTLQRRIKHFRTLHRGSPPFSVNAIIKGSAGDYIFFAGDHPGGFRLAKDLSSITALQVTSADGNAPRVGYYGNVLYNDSKQAITAAGTSFYKTDFSTGSIAVTRPDRREILGSLYFKNQIIYHIDGELVWLDAVTFRELKRRPLNNTGGVRCFLQGAGNFFYVGSNKGIFKVDDNGRILMHLTTDNGLPDECIYAMLTDESGMLWCSTNKGIFRLNKDNSILLINKEDGLQENEFNTNVAAAAEDGELFFGGVNGVSSFYPKAISGFSEKISLLITGIKVNNEKIQHDSAVWKVREIAMMYNKNSVSFDFIAMAQNNPEQYVYQYRMPGIDKEWQQNVGLQTVRYLLPPGKYRFQVYASRFFDKDALPLREIAVTVHPPFWTTWWFISLALLGFSGLLIYIIHRYNFNKYQKRIAEIQTAYKVRMERERISRDLHDNIGAYANAVLYNTELLQQQKEESEREGLMNDLRFASKDIITALRESVWALKKDRYTAQECMLRIINFMHPFNRYYPKIKFRTEEHGVPEMVLDSTRALSIVRIMQEAVTNAIKHSGARNITFGSSLKNEQWLLSIQDDGAGFDTRIATEKSSGNGLNNIRVRAAEAGFPAVVHSARGRGTKVSISISITSNNDEHTA